MRRGLLQIGVVEPEGFAIGNDALRIRCFVIKAEAIRARKRKLARAGFGFGGAQITVFADGLRHRLGEVGATAARVFDEFA